MNNEELEETKELEEIMEKTLFVHNGLVHNIGDCADAILDAGYAKRPSAIPLVDLDYHSVRNEISFLVRHLVSKVTNKADYISVHDRTEGHIDAIADVIIQRFGTRNVEGLVSSLEALIPEAEYALECAEMADGESEDTEDIKDKIKKAKQALKEYRGGK